MALVSTSTYKSPFWLVNGHFETMYPPLFRKISMGAKPKTMIIDTPDHDFFDLNYYNNESDRTAIITHGLEGNNQRAYVMGMVSLFFSKGWNVIAWNYRGCNGEVNNSIKSYHSGFTEDLQEVIKFANGPQIKSIALVGFSLGGNLTLKYLGNATSVDERVKYAVVFSVPLDLHLGCLEISKRSNFIYSERFLRSLKKKVREKARKFPEIETRYLPKVKDLMSFDDYYTAPMHGFKDALDYYQSCSSIYVLENIKVPSLIVNARNDPFLPEACYPYQLLEKHPNVWFETPARGGHVGFCSQNGSVYYWSEIRAIEFIESLEKEKS